MANNQRQIKISDSEINAIAEKMNALPQKPKADNGMRDKADVLKQLVPSMRQMLQRGYSISNIAEFLKEQSIVVSSVSISKSLKTHPRRPRRDVQKPESQSAPKPAVATAKPAPSVMPKRKAMPFGKSDEV
jgi:IS30 family transposase